MFPKLLVGALVGVVVGISSTASMAEEEKPYMVFGYEIPEYLQDAGPGDPKAGRKTAVTKNKGNCLACHTMPIPEESDHGLTGPGLGGVGSRMTEGEIRLRIVNPKIVSPETMMPAFYKSKGLHRVLKKHEGKTILTAQEVEDIVAYLATLKDE